MKSPKHRRKFLIVIASTASTASIVEAVKQGKSSSKERVQARKE